MIAKGVVHPRPVRLARYLITGKADEQAELWQLRGFAADDIEQAFRSIQVIGAATKCRNTFFHLSLRVRDEERLDRSQWEYAANRIERMLGLDDQPRALAFHRDLKTGNEHLHIAWTRINLDTLKAKPLPYFKTRLKAICRELEKTLGLAPVPNQRESSIRFAPRKHEEEQARRLGLNIHDVRETIRQCFDRSDCGHSFEAALNQRELVLARGDSRDFVVLDHAGGMHALGKRILDIPAKEIRARLGDLRRERLPSVEEGRALIIGRQEKSRGSLPETHSVAQVIPEPEPPAGRTGQDTETERDGDAAAPFTATGPPRGGNDLGDSNPGEETAPEGVPASASTLPSERSVPGPPTQQRRGFAHILKGQFRAAVRALTRRLPAQTRSTRRRRSGETVGRFRLAALSILRPIIRLPVVSRAVGFLNDTLPWLHLWESNEAANHDSGWETGSRDNDRLSPHP